MRYAIYFAPDRNDALWRLGSHWLGRDAYDGNVVPQVSVPGFTADEIAGLTASPRRYGFHATLKPPFRLADGRNEDELIAALRDFAATAAPPCTIPLDVARLGGFLALRPVANVDLISAFAARVVKSIDRFRAPSRGDEIVRWNKVGSLSMQLGISPGQTETMARWGYPYLFQDYRFHMTLTDCLAGEDRDRLLPFLRTHFQSALSVPRFLDRMALFVEPGGGKPFQVLASFTLASAARATARRRTPGRLVLVVGPSGAGKDTLIKAARQATFGDDRFVFAKRIVTRKPDPSREDHETVDEAGFAALAAAGDMALSWRAHGLSYGLLASIDASIGDGRVVIANVSRTILDDARLKYAGLKIIHVTASADALAKRLAGRDRETKASIANRLARAGEYAVTGPDVVEIDNSGSLDTAKSAFLAAIAD